MFVVFKIKKTISDYSLNPESLVGRYLHFKDLEPYKPEIMQLSFLDADTIEKEKIGFYFKDNEHNDNIDLIMVVSEINTKNKSKSIVLSKQLNKYEKIYLPKKYLSSKYHTVYITALNKSDKPISRYNFSLKTDQLGSDVFEDIKTMNALVSYTAGGSTAAQNAFKAINKKGPPKNYQEKSARWDAVIKYGKITGAMEHNGKTYEGICDIIYHKDKSLVIFSFNDILQSRNNRKNNDMGYLNGKAIHAFVHKDSLVIREIKDKDSKIYGKATMTQDKLGNLQVNLNVTEDLYVKGVQEGRVNMKITLIN
jgi:hypothetical protein